MVRFSLVALFILDFVLHVDAMGSSASLDRDLMFYERKSLQFLANTALDAQKKAAEDPNGNSSKELKDEDPVIFWSLQVCIRFSLVVLKLTLTLFKEASGDFRTGLPQFALDILSTPATSCSSERIFSSCGQLTQNRSASTKPETLEARILIKCNDQVDI